MSKRPFIKLKLDRTDIFLEVLGWLSICVIWIMIFMNYSDLPETIPTHFDAKGKADSFGSKNNTINIQFVLTLLFIGMTMLTSFPHRLNYWVQITKENAKRQYQLATKLIRVLKLMVSIVFGLLFYQTIENSYGNASGLGLWFFPVTISLFLFPILFYLYKSSKEK